MSIKKGRSGFTLVELMVVVSIIGILAALLLTNFNSARSRTRDAARKADLREVKTALRLLYNDLQAYPPDDGSGNIQYCGAANDSVCVWGVDGLVNNSTGTVYMKVLPVDPINGTAGSVNYVFRYTLSPFVAGPPDTDTFLLETYLENASDEDAAKSQLRCDPNVTSLTDPDIVPQRYMVCED